LQRVTAQDEARPPLDAHYAMGDQGVIGPAKNYVSAFDIGRAHRLDRYSLAVSDCRVHARTLRTKAHAVAEAQKLDAQADKYL